MVLTKKIAFDVYSDNNYGDDNEDDGNRKQSVFE